MLHWIDYVKLERLCYSGVERICCNGRDYVTLERLCYIGKIMLHWRDYVKLERLCFTGEIM